MLLFKNGSFHLGDVSFCIPDGYYLETDPDVCLENGLSLFPPDQSCAIELSWERSEGDSERVLEDWVKDFIEIAPIAPYLHNGLTGHIALYKDRINTTYCEILFDICDDAYNLFRVYFQFRKGTDISDFVERPEFLQIMRSIRKNGC